MQGEKHTSPLVVVLGLSPTGLYVIRELSTNGFCLLGVTDEKACGQYTRYLNHPDKFWCIQDNSELLERLYDLADTAEKKPVLLPTSDRYVDLISSNREVLKQKFIFQESYVSGLSNQLLDKGLFYRLCGQHGIEAPQVWEPLARSDLAGLISHIHYPCIIKPKLIHLARQWMSGNKVFLIKDRTEYENVVSSLPDELVTSLVQEVIPGPEDNITLFAGYFDKQGKALQVFTARKLRQYPPGFGSASFVSSEICRETVDLSIQFMEALGFRGICGTEFKRDPRDGKLKIIEINPRPTLWFSLSTAAGKCVTNTACRDMLEMALPPDDSQDEMFVWRYFLKDLSSSLFYGRNRNSFVFPVPVKYKEIAYKQVVWPVFAAHDPVPSLAEPLLFVKKAAERWFR